MPVTTQENKVTMAENEPPPKKRSNSGLLTWITVLLILLGGGWFYYWHYYLQYCAWTDDAYANGNHININTAINGSVIAFYADDTDLVAEGQLLVQLDSTDYRLAYEKELSSLASTVLQVRQLYSDVLIKQANVDNRRVEVARARFDYENRLQLVDSKAVSNEDFTHAKDILSMTELNLKQAEYELQKALDAAGNTAPENHPLIEKQKAAIRTAYSQLKHCSIYAPATGYVAQRSAEVGQWATPMTPLMAVIPQDYLWVDANFKETQLSKMRIGQPAVVTFDLYGSKVKFEGKVLGIAFGTGSVFSLIPPQNATGNWIKIVQRLPVRISLDPEKIKEYPIRLGISAEVDVDTQNQDLPRIALESTQKPISSTKVFDINMEEVDALINDVVKNNMKGL